MKRVSSTSRPKAVGKGCDFAYSVAHHPAQQIDVVNALVHEASAVLRPGAAPGGLTVVAFPPVPAHAGGAVIKAAESSFVQGFAYFYDRAVESVLMTDADGDASPFSGGDYRVGVGKRKSDRLFDNDRTSGGDTVEGYPGVAARRRRDRDEIRLFLFEHPGVRRIYPRAVKAESCLLFLRRERVGIAEGDSLQPDVQRRLQVIRTDAPASDECVFHNCPFKNGKTVDLRLKM